MRTTIAIGSMSVLLGLVMGTTATAATQSDSRSDVARGRAATQQYHDAAVAVQDGFHATNVCAELPDGSAGMGFHYVNFGRIDGDLIIEEPEVVIYAPTGNGHRKLVAFEYLIPDADQNLATDDDRPSLFGQAFDGPMLGHEPGMPIHYDLHVWAWEANPDGIFAQWNPNVSC